MKIKKSWGSFGVEIDDLKHFIFIILTILLSKFLIEVL